MLVNLPLPGLPKGSIVFSFCLFTKIVEISNGLPNIARDFSFLFHVTVSFELYYLMFCIEVLEYLKNIS